MPGQHDTSGDFIAAVDGEKLISFACAKGKNGSHVILSNLATLQLSKTAILIVKKHMKPASRAATNDQVIPMICINIVHTGCRACLAQFEWQKRLLGKIIEHILHMYMIYALTQVLKHGRGRQ